MGAVRKVFIGQSVVAAAFVFAGFLAPLPASTTSGSVPVRILVVDAEPEAQRILDLLKGGADFGVLAREKSTDPTSLDGGYMGFVDPAALRTELRQAIENLAAGRISNVIALPAGFAIVKVLAPSEADDISEAGRLRQFALSAVSNIRWAPDVSGINETAQALAALNKPDGWNSDPARMCAVRTGVYARFLQRLQNFFDPNAPKDGPTTTNPLDLAQMRAAFGEVYAYDGQMDKATEQWEIAYQMALTELPNTLQYMEETLGVGYMHRAEMENDIYTKPGDRCLFPMRPSLKLEKTESAEKAIQHFLAYLSRKPDELEVIWMLNLTYMMLGRYPQDVPPRHLIPPSDFTSAEDIGRFTDVAPQAGLDLFSRAGGIIADEFENNGLFDVVTSSMDYCAPMHFFHNNGDGTFADQTARAGIGDQMGGLNMVQTDFNNDGCLDILVLRGGWDLPQRKSLLRNNCDGTFTDVTEQAGLARPLTATQTGVWADINNDGLLDLFVGNENAPAQLFLNQGDGTFKDIAHSAGVDKVAFVKAVAAADYDNDGCVDFYLTTAHGDNFLYHNNHDDTFTEIAAAAGVLGPGNSFGAWFFDYDNDGWPDLFVNSYFPSIEETARTYLGQPHGATTLKLYKNLHNGAFRDVSREVGLDKVYMPMGANFGDVDNDGYLDIYLGTGNPSYGSLVPNVLLRNDEGKHFTDITFSSGTGELHKGHAVVFADLDNRGDEHILTSVGGAVTGDRHTIRLFENPGGHGNDWIRMHLVGVKANRAAIGARIKLTVRNQGAATRSIYRTVSSGGSFGASPLEQHIGLGKDAQILAVEIRWPGDATPQTFAKIGKNQTIEIKQFAHDYRRLSRPPFRLGGAARGLSISASAASSQD